MKHISVIVNGESIIVTLEELMSESLKLKDYERKAKKLEKAKRELLKIEKKREAAMVTLGLNK